MRRLVFGLSRSLVKSTPCRSYATHRLAFSRSQQYLLPQTQRFFSSKIDEESHSQGSDGEFEPGHDENLVIGKAKRHEFQAKTRKILDIVTHSLYSEREVFVREMISNCSDALEKLRLKQLTGDNISDSDQPLTISITTDSKNNFLIIEDTGVGLTEAELIENLGTIAQSGTEQFLRQMEDNRQATTEGSLIGQFGVGFYSTFMVADEVSVYSKSANPNEPGHVWTSDGSGTYEIAPCEGLKRGTKIVMKLKESQREFSDPMRIENIIKKYSNFVNFPIRMNNEIVNTVKALWTMPKDKISEQDHKEFYQFISHSYDTPLYRLAYRTDTPLEVSSLFYIPSTHSEKFGYGRMELDVKLFCRKVLITNKAEGLLPSWLRFIKGVVDCPDLSLNISREHLQDNALIKRLSTVLTRRILKFLAEEAQFDPEGYIRFYNEFSMFLKEGMGTSFEFKNELARLFRCETSAVEAGKMSSLDDYISRMQSDQDSIYYFCAPNRQMAETSPYFEDLKRRGIEVLFLYSEIDEFVMHHLVEYETRKFKSIENNVSEAKDDVSLQLEHQQICDWVQSVLSDRVSSVKVSSRLVDSPAIITDHQSSTMHRMMKMMDPANTPKISKQKLEINPKHSLFVRLSILKDMQPEVCKLVAEQIFDNAMISAGLLDDSRHMVPRLNRLLEKAMS